MVFGGYQSIDSKSAMEKGSGGPYSGFRILLESGPAELQIRMIFGIPAAARWRKGKA
jgi:hypothetical protein